MFDKLSRYVIGTLGVLAVIALMQTHATPASAALWNGVIDDFSTDQDTAATDGTNPTTENNPTGSIALTGVRTYTVTAAGLFHSNMDSTDGGGGILAFSTDSDTTGAGETMWTFDSTDFSSADNIGVVVRQAGATTTDAPEPTMTFTLFDSDGDSYALTLDITDTITAYNLIFDFADAGWVETSLVDGFDFNDVIKINMLIDTGGHEAYDISIAFIGEIPEPATLALFGIGLLGFGALLRRRRRQTGLAA